MQYTAFTIDAFDRLAEPAVTPRIGAAALADAIRANDRAIDRRVRCVGSTDRLRAALAARWSRPA